MRQKVFVVVILVCFLWVGQLYAQDAPQIEITTPTTGDTLFGLIEITGTASAPNFDRYSLEWSNAQNPDVWLPIQQPVSQQVTASVLGQWDTVGSAVPDGVYQIRLRMFLQDETVETVEITNLRVANAEPTQIPTPIPPLPTSTNEPDQDNAAPLIEQPPTVTPVPTFPPAQTAPDTTAPDIASDTDSLSTTSDTEIFNVSAVQSAFCNGMLFSGILFGIIIAYLLVRRQLSPLTRRIWYQVRSEMDNDQ